MHNIVHAPIGRDKASGASIAVGILPMPSNYILVYQMIKGFIYQSASSMEVEFHIS